MTATQITDNSEWQPIHFDSTCADDRAAVAALRTSIPAIHVFDTIAEQLRELLVTRDPAADRTPRGLDRRVHAHLDGRPPDDHGEWIWYPWSRDLVHVLPENEFREVRTDRNRYLITPAEQRVLAGKRIGVIGLSVGKAAALTLAQEGVGGSFKLADHDRLGLSNLNRLHARVADLGIEKTVVAARQLFELDPYLRIDLCRTGIRPDDIDEFLLGGGRLDLVVEECDDLRAKVLIREHARLHGIPVLMQTSDRGLLDIERFDLEPDRPVLHGLLGDTRADDLRDLTARDKIPHILAIMNDLSPRAAASLPEVGHTIGSWPQLASGITLGGAIIADAARRLLLGAPLQSGRYYVDPAHLVGNAGSTEAHSAAAALANTPSRAETAPSGGVLILPAEPTARGRVTDAAIRWIAAMGTLAPSAHNAQPWALIWRRAAETLECHHDPARDLPALDFEHTATWVAFGALLENIALAATHLGLRAEPRPWPDPEAPNLVCAITFGTAPTPLPESTCLRQWNLFPYLTTRATNRTRGIRRRLDEDVAEVLTAVCAEHGGHLQLLRTAPELVEIGALIGAGDRLSLLNRSMHHDLIDGYRWTPREAQARPYGIDLATAELTASERAAFTLIREWPVMAHLAEIGGGRALEDISREAVASAAAVGLLTVPGATRESYLHGGRLMQRMWLTATAEGIALQPMTALPYLFARLDGDTGDDILSTTERHRLHDLRARYRTLFATPPATAEILLFRLAYTDQPSARSVRLPLEQVLTFAR
ncbi:Rv1355c family protein [Nocardia sp. 2]|uniref:Rv1355c family protein n=1 Tax=Nocardia acididurans TaxID=2802282 RepID=A0ABS1MCB3_9NOCA|nr:Rv1355c family protein [Nocardia acididurans]MBL1078209.1 Rv1355c family protein [Nocardia acididurans]